MRGVRRDAQTIMTKQVLKGQQRMSPDAYKNLRHKDMNKDLISLQNKHQYFNQPRLVKSSLSIIAPHEGSMMESDSEDVDIDFKALREKDFM